MNLSGFGDGGRCALKLSLSECVRWQHAARIYLVACRKENVTDMAGWI